MADDRITIETEVTPAELACVLGVSGRYIRQMAEDGLLEKVGGRFVLCDAVASYVGSLKKEKTASKQDDDKQAVELRIKRAKATMAEMEAKELQGKMHRSEDVVAMTEDLVFCIRSMLVALPGRLAVDAVRAETAAEASDIFRKEIHAIMSELANYKYDPQKYEERVRERRRWGSLAGCEDEDGEAE